MRILLPVLLFVVINTLSFEYLINRSQSTVLTVLAVAIFVLSLYYLIYQPLKKLNK